MGVLKIGGSARESNPPETLLTPLTGFEVQEAHQDLTTSSRFFLEIIRFLTCLKCPACPVRYSLSDRVKKHGVNLKIFTSFRTG